MESAQIFEIYDTDLLKTYFQKSLDQTNSLKPKKK